MSRCFFHSLTCCSKNTERTSGVSRWRHRSFQPEKNGKVKFLSHCKFLERKGTEWKGAPLEEQTDAAACWKAGQPFSHLPSLLWFGALPCPFLRLKIKYWSKKILSSNGCSADPTGQWGKIKLHLFNFYVLTETTSYTKKLEFPFLCTFMIIQLFSATEKT